MKNTSTVRLAIRFAVFYCTIAGICQSIHAQPVIQFRLVRDTVIVVPVTVDGEGPFDFVLDTGADTTILDSSLAAKLSLPSLSRAQQTTMASVQGLTVTRIPILEAGPIQVKGLPALVQDLSEVRKVDSHIEGIVGQDFLSHFNYLLDYRKRSILIELDHEILDTIDGDHVPVDTVGNKMTVASKAQSRASADLRLLLDSGANSLVLMRTASQTLNLLTQKNGLEVTSSGQVGLQVGRLQDLEVGSQRFHDVTVAVSVADPSERVGDGLLPTSLFRVLYVNNRDCFVVFNPKSKR